MLLVYLSLIIIGAFSLGAYCLFYHIHQDIHQHLNRKHRHYKPRKKRGNSFEEGNGI